MNVRTFAFAFLTLVVISAFAACTHKEETYSQDDGSDTARLSETPRSTRTPRPTPTRVSPEAIAFANADCWGSRVDECLAVNPAVDAIASDPAVCHGAEHHVCLVPVGKVRLDVIEAIVDFHRETKGLDVVVLPSIPMRKTMIDPNTYQVAAEVVHGEMEDVYGASDESASTFVAITPIDIKPLDGYYAWMFGSRRGSDAQGNHNRGVFSYFRMANVEPYSGKPLTDDLLGLRAAKYTARYTALLYYRYPLGDDKKYLNYRSMMGFSDLDSMGTEWPAEPAPGPY